MSFIEGVAAGQTVDFLSSTGSLELTSPANFLGSIGGFDGSKAIDLIDVAANGLSYDSSVLTLTESTGGGTATLEHFPI